MPVGAPIDYSIQVADPFERSMRGFQMGGQLAAAVKQARMAPELEAQAAAKKQSLIDFVNNPNPTAMDYQKIVLTNPELAVPLKQGWDAMGEDRKKAIFGEGLQVMSALEGGQSEIASQLLARRAEAERNSGDLVQANIFDTYSQLAKVNPTALKQIVGLNLAGGDPEKFAENYERMAQLPGRVAQQGAELGKTTAETGKIAVETRLKEIDEKFAPQKFLADLGLIAAQTESARGSAEASRASAAASRATAGRENAAAGQMRAGIIPSEKRPEAEGKLRKEYSDQTKSYQDVKSAFSRITASQDNAAGDLSLIFNYMKMLDPGSTVREGEFASAQNATGVPSRILNKYNNIISGERLNPGQRKEFIGQAKTLYGQARVQENTVRKGVERIAKGYGLDPQNIFYEAVESTPITPTVAPTLSGLMPAQKAVLSRADAILARGRK
jgi:hypothetical protein